jgi:hypothetical protein
MDSMTESMHSVSESKWIEALTFALAASGNAFNAESGPSFNEVCPCVLECLLCAVWFMVRLIGTSLSKPNTAGSAAQVQRFRGDRVVAAAVFHGQKCQ